MKKIIRAFTDTGDDDTEKKHNMMVRLNLAETTLQAHELQLQMINSVLNENIDNLHEKFHTIEKEVNIFHEKLQARSQTSSYHSMPSTAVGSGFTTVSEKSLVCKFIFYKQIYIHIYVVSSGF